ncbi:signal peptidase II [Gallaecimonas sp. GXIMD4217]|uniref:signal peptidase II n=1 Tax=Gallaecimonas sp. GXIMD4217 TaxID=3131927 RepID=UPI00311AE6A8
MMPMKQSGLRWLWLALLAIVLDLGSKYWVLGNFSLYERVNLLPFFDFVYVRNYGAAFSFLSDEGGWQRWFFTAIAVGVSLFLLLWLRRLPASDRLQGPAAALILGGALGNLHDRLVHGYVVDFLDFYVGSWHWPAFNIADSAICVGAALLILASFRSDKSESQ